MNIQNTQINPGIAHIPPPSPTKVNSISAPPTSVLKKLLPLSTFFMAFATVMTVLLIYMDNTALKHYQFRLNMSQDYDFMGVTQDNPELVMYIKEVFLAPAIEKNHKPIEFNAEGPSEDVAFVLQLLKNKKGGTFVESGAYNDGHTSKTEWLEKQLLWKGLLIQPDPRHYFNLIKHNRTRSQAAHACLSPMPYPKEVPLHHQSQHDGIKINSILPNNFVDEPDWFNTRVKCFPLYSFLLAINTTNLDYFSLESAGTELQILETIPFDRVNIKVISVNLDVNRLEVDIIKDFLLAKNYIFKQKINNSFIYIVNQ